MKQQLRQIYDDLSNGRLSQQEALEKIKALKTREQGKAADVLLVTPVWEEGGAAAGQGPEYGEHHVVLCELPSISVEALLSALPDSRCLSLHSTEGDVARRYSDHAQALLERIQEILQNRAHGKALVQCVVGDDQEQILFAGLSSLLLTATKEDPRIVGQLIVVPSGVTAEELGVRLAAEKRRQPDSRIRYSHGGRQILRWQEIPTPPEPAPIAFQDSGVYLITGGFGGLGVLFAKELLERTQSAKVILTGRSVLSAEKQARSRALGPYEGRWSYRQVELGDLAQVTQLVEGVKAEHGSLTGILHCAGMVADSLIVRKSAGELREVLAPKVGGTLHLDHASRDLELDFFVLFSSVVGALGNVGQADYAAANGFMDQFAAFRNGQVIAGQRHGRTRSINWPLWQDGGMDADAGSWELLRESTGMLPMQTAAGLDAFHRIVAGSHDQVLVAEGDLAHLRRALIEGLPTQPEGAKPSLAEPESGSAPMDADTLLEKTEEYLRRQCSELLKLPFQAIDPQAALEKYGIDSILAMKLTNHLEKTFGSLSKALFFEYQTIRELSGYFVQSHPARLAALFPSTNQAGKGSQATISESSQASRDSRMARRRLGRPVSEAPRVLETEPIAIIGLSGRYPEAVDLDAYWRNLRDGKDCIVEVPKDRWDWREYFSDDRTESGRHYSKWGGFIAGMDQFDPLFFGISPKEARQIDPQERLFLQHAWMAMEDAGYTRAGLQVPCEDDLPGQAGVYAGVMYTEYQLLGAEAAARGKNLGVASSGASIANRVSYALNLHGPSITLDTMCSSSLTAIHFACLDLKLGRTTLAIAGGVNVSIHPNKYLVLSAGQFISSDGHCQSFGEGGDGYIPGEGVGVVVLKRLSDAERDGDHIYGVIRGSALNHGGKTNGYTVPNPQAQATAISRALAEARIDARQVSYIEAHGTGTKLGDPIEIAALNRAFQRNTTETGFCLIGSAKSNIGHCESAAGIAGLTKVLLQMQHQQIVPSLHSAQLNPHIDFTASPFVVNQTLRPWEQPLIEGRPAPRIAGISSFGAGGSNAHMVVEEYPVAPHRPMTAGPVVILLSARIPEQLEQKARQLLDFVLARRSSVDLASLAYTLQVGREAMEERLAFVVSTLDELVEKLQDHLAGGHSIEDVYQGQVKRNRETLAVFTADADLQQTVEKWIANRKLSKLADLWVKGLELDWSKLHGDARPRRMSLPTYPFAEERYWVELPAARVLATQRPAAVAAVLHPLLHANASDLHQQSYRSTFHGDESALRMQNGQRVLPTAAYLEMARAAVVNAATLASDATVELRDVVWAEPVEVAGEKRVDIALFASEANRIDFEIFSGEGHEEVIHCQGRALWSQEPAPARIDLAQLEARRNGQVVTRLRLPRGVENSARQYVLHPSLLDSALAACVALFEGTTSRLPFAVDSLRIVAPCGVEMVAWARFAAGSVAKDAVVKLDLDLCDEHGNVAVQMRGISWQTASPETVEITEPVAPSRAISAIEIPAVTPVRREIVIAPPIREVVRPVERKSPVAVSLSAPGSLAAASGRFPDSSARVLRAPIALSNAALGATGASTTAPSDPGLRMYDEGNGVHSIHIAATSDAIGGLLAALRRVQEEATLKVLVLDGLEHCFAQAGRSGCNEAVERKVFEAIVGFPFPVIASLSADTIGAAFMAAALCDFMVCSETATYGYTDVASQLHPTASETALLSERLGFARAEHLLFTATAMTGAELRASGWASPIVPADQVTTSSMELAATLAAKSKDALRLLKQHLTRSLTGLVKELTSVPAEPSGDRSDAVTGAIASPSEHIHLDTPTDRVLVIEWGSAAHQAGLKDLAADLRYLMDAVRDGGYYKAIVLAGHDAEFLAGAETVSDEVLVEFQQILLDSAIPVVVALVGNAGPEAWLIAQHSDACVYNRQGAYSSAGAGLSAAAVFAQRLGNEAAREVLLTGAGYSGTELGQRIGTLVVVEHAHVLPEAIRIAASWAALPRTTLAAWKKQSAERLRNAIRNRVATVATAPLADANRGVDSEPVSIALRSNVVSAVAHPEGIVIVRMEDRESKNMFSEAFIEGVTEAFAHIAQNSACKVVILTGYDRYFASGGTEEALLAIQQGTLKFTDAKVFQLPLDCSLPVIAAMQGHGIGAGWALGMFADVILISEESRYVSPYMNYGFTPGAGATYILPETIGPELARESLMTAQPYMGRELKDRGLRLHVMPRADVQPAAMAMARQIAQAPRQHLIDLKQRLTQHIHEPLEETYRLELAMHDQTFVGHSGALAQIQTNFQRPSVAAAPTVTAPAVTAPAVAAPVVSASGLSGDLLPAVSASLRALLASELQMRESDIDDNAQFIDLGLDSIGGVTWMRKINAQYGTSIEATKIYSFPTLAQLSRHVKEEAEQHGALSASTAQVAADTPIVARSVPEPQREIVVVRPSGTLTSWRNRKQARFAATTATRTAEPIAVIGMAGQFPQAGNVEEFWRNIAEGRNCISEIPATRWDLGAHYQPGEAAAGKTNSQWLGVLEEADCFDPLFFNISPTEAENMDPQQRLFLQECWHSIENAGYAAESLSGSKCGVFVGCAASDYHQASREHQLSAHGFTGSATSILAARISYFLNLQGPCLSIDTACSSSLVAIAEACDSLLAGDSDIALAGGVCVLAGPDMHIKTAQAGMLSPEGRCYTFDQRADGFVPGEGVGVVVLKRLSDAQRDGDIIHGVLEGWAVNQDGKSNGITAPNPESQTRLEQYVYDKYQIDPSGIQLIEAHGTGTKLGDPIEVEGLKNAFRKYTRNSEYCALGSVKSNIGHTLTAAGVAGVIKLLLALKHRQLPPTINFEQLNEHIDLKGSPFYVNARLQDWVPGEGVPRRAAISSFGFSGTNAHVVVGEYLPPAGTQPARAIAAPHGYLVPLSAKTPAQLAQKTRDLLDFIRGREQSLDLADLAYTLQVGRDAMDERLGIVATSLAQLAETLQAHVDGAPVVQHLYQGQVKRNRESLSLISQDADARETLVARWISQGKHFRLLELWVKGLDLDWNRLHGDAKPRRIALPGYPFAKEHYWIEAATLSGRVADGTSSAILHPLLHSNTSDFSQQSYLSTFSGDEFFLRDHQVRTSGEHALRVLPGMAYLEMARAAFAQASGESMGSDVVELHDTVWMQPVVVVAETLVSIALIPGDGDAVAFEIYSGDVDQPVVHCQGRVVLSSQSAPAQLDLESLAGETGEGSLDAQGLYAACARMGLLYGPSFQAVTDIRRGRGQVLAQLRLPELVRNTAGDYGLHPSLLDSALQAALGLTADPSELSDRPRLPFALETLRITGPCGTEMVAWVRYAANSRPSDSVVKVDIDLCDERGSVCVQMKGLSLRVASKELVAVSQDGVEVVGVAEAHGSDSARAETIAVMMAAPVWQASELDPRIVSGMYAEQHVVLCELPYVSAESLASLLPRSGVLALPSSSETTIAQRYSDAARACFEKIQEILRGKPAGSVLFQIVVADGKERTLFAGLSGLLKTAALENPRFAGQLILVPAATTSEELSRLLEGEKLRGSDPLVRYEQGVRQVQRWQEIATDMQEPPVAFRDDGVYLITGGLGALGLLLAEEVIHRTTNAHVIVTGRSPRTAETQALLERFGEQAKRVHHHPADLGELAQVEALLAAIGKQHGRLDGVLHCAGTIADNFIFKKTSGEFANVLLPKVIGTEHLDLASRELELDFFVLFSSVAGVLGNVGQANYATANGFLDQFAALRNRRVAAGQRAGRTYSIDWALWQAGGMVIDAASREVLERATGMRPMQTASGLRAFHRILASAQAQVLVAEGEPARMRQILPGVRAAQTGPAVEAPALTVGIDAPSLKEKTQDYLRKQLSGLLKMPADRIDPQAALEKYGIDSILAVKLTSRLEEAFGSLSKTLFFEYQTIAELTEYFLQSHTGRLSALLATPATSAVDAMSGALPPRPVQAVPHSSRRIRRGTSVASRTTPEAEPIAIIGLSGRYPEAVGIEAYWQNLRDGKDCIVEVPKDRWDWRAYFTEDRTQSGHHYSKWGGFIEGVDEFDPLFFGIAPKDAKTIDPQERLFLQHAWLAMEDAGYTRANLQIPSDQDLPGQVGVYAGVMYSEYQLFGVEATLQGQRMGVAGSAASIANRVSYALNLHGPSMTLDTMCSSSLTAIHLACQDLKQGRTSMAIAGGVNVTIHPNKYLVLSAGQFISSEGACQSFGEGGDGYIPGEGVGVVILKRLSDAERDGDHIYGVIRGSALNHGGKTNGYTVPNPQAQSSAISRALAESRTDARRITYIEAHGTGTKLGDPIEIAALTKAFHKYTQDTGFCLIGSAKSNIGHCESAAGIAGLTKVLLQLQHRQLVPSLHSAELNPHIDFDSTPFVVNQVLRPWDAPVIEGKTLPRIAGISSFGAGGSNAHVLVEEYPAPAQRTTTAEKVLILLSARTPGQLAQRASDLLSFIRTRRNELDLGSIAYTLQAGREAMEERAAFVVSSIADLVAKLGAYVAGEEGIDDAYQGQVKRNREALSVFGTDADLQQALDRWIANRKLSKLADLWVKGLELDWNKLYDGDKPRRVSLPAYPFARERHWIEIAAGVAPVMHGVPSGFLHPLVHSNISDPGELRYRAMFTGEEPFFGDPHMSAIGEKELRAVACLEMARAAITHAFPAWCESAVLELHDTVWAEPIVAGRSVFIALLPNDADGLDFEIYGHDGEREVIHCQGRAAASDEPAPAVLDLESLRNRTALPAHGEVLANLRLPKSAAGDYVLHPSLLDGAVQAAIGLIGDAQLRVPLALDTVRIMAPCDADLFAWVRLASASTGVLDIDLCDERGKVVAQLRGLRLQAALPVMIERRGEVEAPRAVAAVTVPRSVKEISFIAAPAPALPSPVNRTKATGIALAAPSALTPTAPEARRTSAEKPSVTLASTTLGAPVQDGGGSSAPAVRLYDHGEGVFAIRILTLDGGHFTAGVTTQLLAALDRVQREAEAKVVLLSGLESGFLGGVHDEAVVHGLYAALATFPIPVIGVLAKETIGPAFLAAALCDFMVWNEDAVYGYTDARELHAHHPEWALFRARFGDAQARHLLSSAHASTGRQLRASGWTCPMVPAGQVESYAQELAATLATKSREALRLLKHHLNRDLAGLVDGRTCVDAGAPPTPEVTPAVWSSMAVSSNAPALPAVPVPVPLTSQVVRVTAHPGGVVLIAMEERQARNMFSEALVQGLREAFAHVEQTPSYKVVILTGYDNYFASGGTKESLLSIQQGNAKFTDLDVFRLALECRLPVIAAIQGHGIGAGLAMGLFADLVLLAEEGTYVSPYMNYGFTPGAGATWIVPEKFGQDLGREGLLTGKSFTGSELKQRGLALPILPRAEVVPAALTLAGQLATHSRDALMALKEKWIAYARPLLEETFRRELAMHEQTFVGRADTLVQIEKNFQQVSDAPVPVATPVRVVETAPSSSGREGLANVTATLRTLLASELQMGESDVDEHAQFVDLGLDSITGVTWIRKINEKYGTSIEATKVYSYPTLAELSRHVKAEAEALSPVPAVVEARVVAAIPVAVQAVRAPQQAMTTRRHRRAVAPRRVAQSSARNTVEPIAIIGIAGQFPQAKNVDEFWRNIAEGRNCISQIPRERWDVEAYYQPGEPVPGKTSSQWVGALEDYDLFDPLFFNISPTEAESMDPQQRLFLQTSWHSIEDAGYDARVLSGSKCGVFVGCAAGDYHHLSRQHHLSAQGFTGSAMSILAARISYFLNLQGPCVSIDTACSSSLVAIAQACDSLISGGSDLALAGGVYVMAGPDMHIMTSQAAMLSPAGRCFTFDQRADGFVPGEGVGVIVLKRLADAERDGDLIRGVIRGWGVNQDGRTNGITAPNPESQTRLEQEVYDKFGIDPSTIQLIEAHGTGTKLGDPIEVEGLKAAFKKYTQKREFCALGSVKSNIGHCLTAAGAAGVIKLLLAMQHRQLPPTINFEKLNEHIDLTDSPFHVNTQLQAWEPISAEGLQAAISSFGFSGTNAHLVIGEYVTPVAAQRISVAPRADRMLIPLSARTTEQLQQKARDLADFIRGSQSLDLVSAAYTLQVGRQAMDERLGFVVRSIEQLSERLDAFLSGEQVIEDSYRGQARRGKASMGMVGQDEDLTSAVVDRCIEEQKFGKLLELWVHGVEVDWSRLYGGDRPRRVSLPAYPFARERYWIDMSAIEPAVATSVTAVLHPPVHLNTAETVLATPAWQTRAIEASAKTSAERHVLLCEFPGVSIATLEARMPNVSILSLQDEPQRSMAERYGAYAEACFERVQSILQAKSQDGALVQLVVPGDPNQGPLNGLTALLRTAALESPKFAGQLLIVGAETTAEELAERLHAEHAGSPEPVVRYAHGLRQVQRWQEVVASQEAPSIAFREDGVYLITGGFGGLGLLFAKEILAGTDNARVILTGRATLSPERQSRLDGLSATGRVSYRQVDLQDREGVEQLMAGVLDEHHALHGVLHFAGTTADRLIQQKTVSELREVLAPKVTGTFHLDHATREVELDFFVLFSSIAALVGNVGQADYATANAFGDHFAAWRERQVAAGLRRGRTRTINWPLWEAGGMAIDAAGRELLRQTMGVEPMQTASGLRAFYRSLELPHAQTLVLEGDRQKLTAFLRKARLFEPADAVPSAQRVASAEPAPAFSQNQLQQHLASMLGSILKIDPSRIDVDQPFVELGLDSFLGASLVVAVNKRFGTELAHILLFDYPTVRALAQLVGRELEQSAATQAPPAVEPQSTTAMEPTAFPILGSVVRMSGTSSRQQAADRIAIVGMSGRYPQASSLNQYWQNLAEGRNSIVEVPASRWDVNRYYDPDRTQKDKTSSKWLGAMEGVDHFDPLFFRISPQEAEYMDPQHRLFLQESYRAFEDAGYSGSALSNRKCGVYLGMSTNEYLTLLSRNGFVSAPVTSNSYAIAAARIAYHLNLKGPALSIDTACSSALVAIHLACQALTSGEIDMALAGGVSVWLTPESYVAMSQAGMFSPVGQCKTFDESADGIVNGEGVGAVVLKRLRDAERDGDFIHGVILGSGINQDGKTNGITAPSVQSQIELERGIYEKYGIDPGTISYVEAHGTGTKLGDPIEVEALSTVFKEKTDRKNFCGLGSVKSNIGHTTSAAGVAGLQKVLLSLRHRTLVPTLNVTRENARFDFERSPFYICREKQAWEVPAGSLRRAAVSSFGFSGTNAHLVIEEYPAPAPVAASNSDGPVIVPLSARTAEQLRQRAVDLLAFLRAETEPVDLAAVAYTLQVGREAMEERLGFIVRSVDQLTEKLEAFVAGGRNIEDVYRGRVEPGNDGMNLIGGDEDMQVALDRWINSRKMSKLLDLWIRGLHFDWNKLHDEVKPRRIPLPTYPFARERYWMAEAMFQREPERRIAEEESMQSIEDIINGIDDDTIDTSEAVRALKMLV